MDLYIHERIKKSRTVPWFFTPSVYFFKTQSIDKIQAVCIQTHREHQVTRTASQI